MGLVLSNYLSSIGEIEKSAQKEFYITEGDSRASIYNNNSEKRFVVFPFKYKIC